MAVAIETANLTKRYDGFTAVDSLNLRVQEGEVFGFLGPNGAGKTTTILMLLGLTEPTSGQALVLGHDPTRDPLQIKRLAGYLPENLGFYGELRAEDNLRYVARLNGLRRQEAAQKIGEVLELVDLSRAARQRVETFSRGMKQRLAIAGVLLKDPRVVFLDEPTSGLDPEGARAMLDLIGQLSREKRLAVFISSHLLYQVQQICHRMGIIAKGRLVALGSLEELSRGAQGEGRSVVEVEVAETTPQLLEALKGIRGVAKAQAAGNTVALECQSDIRAQIPGVVERSGARLLGMKARGYGLEEIYLRYFREA